MFNQQIDCLFHNEKFCGPRKFVFVVLQMYQYQKLRDGRRFMFARTGSRLSNSIWKHK